MSADEGQAGAAGPGAAGDADEPFDVAQQSLVRPAAVMAVGTALSRITGLLRIVAAAVALGVTESRLADSYNLANTLPISLYELLLGGILTSVFVPVIVEELRTKDHDDAWSSVSAVVTVSLTALAVMSVLVAVVAPLVIELFSSRVDGAEGAEQQDLAGFFLRVFAPQILLFGFAAIMGGLLNAHGRFAVPMFAPIVQNVVLIAVFLTFAAVVSGVPTNAGVGDSLDQKLLLGLGTTGAIAAMAAIYWPFVRRLPGRLRPRFDFRHPVVRKILRLAGWTFLYVVTNTAGLVVSFYLANQVQGGITAYVTAFAFFQLPIGVAAVSIVTALMPRLSANYVDGDNSKFRAGASGGMRALALLLLPATAAYLVLAEPMVDVLLEHGVVRAESVDLVADVLRLFALGLFPFGAYLLCIRSFYARQDTRVPGLVNVGENGATVALDFALFPGLGVKGLALAHTLGYVVGTAGAAVLLARRTGGLELRRTLIQIVRVTIAAAGSAAAMLGALEGVEALVGAGDARSIIQLVGGGTAGVAVFFALSYVLRVEDLTLFRRLLPARFR